MHNSHNFISVFFDRIDLRSSDGIFSLVDEQIFVICNDGNDFFVSFFTDFSI